MEAVNPFAQEIWEASPTTPVAVVDRIKPASGPREEKCGSGAVRMVVKANGRRVGRRSVPLDQVRAAT